MTLFDGLKKPRLTVLAAAVLISIFLAASVYLLIIQSPLLSRREYLGFFLVFFLLVTPVYLLLNRFLIPHFRRYSRRGKILLLIFSALFGLLIAFTTNRPPFYLLFPRHSLVIQVPQGEAASGEKRVITLTWFTDGWQDVSFSQFEAKGNWQREVNRIYLSGSSAGSLRWEGRIKDTARIEFETNPEAGTIRVNWDGVPTDYDLSGNPGAEFITSQTFSDSDRGAVWVTIIFFLTSSFLFLTTTLFFLDFQIPADQPRKKKRFAWLLYSLPMIVVWGYFLFTLYPGIVPEDSVVQWNQVLSGNFTDHHPISYALLMAGVSRLYPFPASVAMTQILMVSLALAWGLDESENMGAPRKVLWGLAVLFAILPINVITTIALFKDVPYATAILTLTIMWMKVVWSRGAWLSLGWHWLGLGLTFASITLFRINGLPIALSTLLLMLLLYHKPWKKLAAAGGVLVILLGLMYGPVYSILKVKHEPEFGMIMVLHHIAAHLNAGTPLTSDQENYLNQIAPIDNTWGYQCCQANPTMIAVFPGVFDQVYDLPILEQDIQKPTRVALDLFLKNPSVDLRHMVCASQIIWSLNSSCPDRLNIHIVQNNIKVVSPQWFPKSLYSQLTQFTRSYILFTAGSKSRNPNLIMAIYLFLAIYAGSIFSVRQKNWKYALFLTPILVQSSTLGLINISQAYRYQYGITLVGLFCIALLFVPGNQVQDDELARKSPGIDSPE